MVGSFLHLSGQTKCRHDSDETNTRPALLLVVSNELYVMYYGVLILHGFDRVSPMPVVTYSGSYIQQELHEGREE